MLRAELRKLTTTRAALGLLIGAVAVTGLGAISTTASAEASTIADPLRSQQLFVLASINLGLFALILGVRSFTDEFRHGTIAWTLLAVRRRWTVVAAKATVAALAAGAIALIAQATMVALAAGVAVTKDATLGLTAGDAPAVLGLAAGAAVWAVLGVAVGALVRHQVAAVVGGLVWVLVIENLVSGFIGDAGRFLPGQAAHGLAGVSAIGDLLPPVAAAVALLAYAAALTALGAASLSRREVALSD